MKWINLQTLIFIFSSISIMMVNIKSISDYACIFGLIGQIFWFIETYNKKLWGMFALTIWFTIAWLIGFYNNFLI